MTLHLRPVPEKPARIDVRPNPKRREEVLEDLKRELFWKRRPQPWWTEKD